MQRIKTLVQEYWMIAVVALGAAGFFWWQSRQPQTLAPVAEASSLNITSSSANSGSSKPQSGFVHIKGAVVKPGLYPVDGTTRWDEVVRLAGGLTADADVSAVNLALIATDQASLWIPTMGEAPAAQTGTSGPTGSGAAAAEASALVNINTASETELQTLSGIGPKKAADIIAYREANGSFAAIEDLKQVSGIGDKTFEALQDAITVGP